MRALQERELGRRGVKARVRALLLGVGARVFNLSEGKPGWKRPAGLPDMWVMMRCPSGYVGFWVETKIAHGRQSEAQMDFQNKCFLCAIDYVCGGEREVRAYLQRIGVLAEGTA